MFAFVRMDIMEPRVKVLFVCFITYLVTLYSDLCTATCKNNAKVNLRVKNTAEQLKDSPNFKLVRMQI